LLLCVSAELVVRLGEKRCVPTPARLMLVALLKATTAI
jgi:hypothetical protein